MRATRRLRLAVVGGLALGIAASGLGPVHGAVGEIAYGCIADDLAGAIESTPGLVSGAGCEELPPDGTPHAATSTPLTGFPTAGDDFAILTTGDATLASQPNTSESSGQNIGGTNVRGDTDYDVSVLRFDLDVPPEANCLRFDTRFLSEEFPEFAGSAFSDAFLAELDQTTWSTSGSTIIAPDNFALGADGDLVTVKTSTMNPQEAAGTTYDGATALLVQATPISPGAHSLYLSIFDQGDAIYDSAVFVDNLRVLSTDTCQPPHLLVTKTPEAAVSKPGEMNGYTISVSNLGGASVPLGSITDALPEGFSYVIGSTTGSTTADPTVAGQVLTWGGPITLPGHGSISLTFSVTVPDAPGSYLNEASVNVGDVVVSSGPTAPVEVAGSGGVTGTSITGSPLTRIAVGEDLACEAHHVDLGAMFFERSACGTFLRVGGTLYGPSVPAGPVATPFVPVAQSPVMGSGTPADPFRIETVVRAGNTGVRLTQADLYVNGRDEYETFVEVRNVGTGHRSVSVYRAADCHVGGDDRGFGTLDPAAGVVGCVGAVGTPAAPAGTARPSAPVAGQVGVEWVSTWSGSRFLEGGYADVWDEVGSLAPFPNDCACGDYLDNGAGLSWSGLSLLPGARQVRSHLTRVTSVVSAVEASKAPKVLDLKAKPKRGRKGGRIRLVATLSPCPATTGDPVELQINRGGWKRVALKPAGDECRVAFRRKLARRTRFRALSPEDAEHLAAVSKAVTVRIRRR